MPKEKRLHPTDSLRSWLVLHRIEVLALLYDVFITYLPLWDLLTLYGPF